MNSRSRRADRRRERGAQRALGRAPARVVGARPGASRSRGRRRRRRSRTRGRASRRSGRGPDRRACCTRRRSRRPRRVRSRCRAAASRSVMTSRTRARVAFVEIGADVERDPGRAAADRRGGDDRGSDGAAPRHYCPPAMRDALTGKVAIVTGASRGIGAAIARRFAAEGARVAIVARSLEPGSGGHLAGSLAEVADGIAADGGVALPIVADLSDPGVRPGRPGRAGSRPSSARSTCSSTTRPRASTSRSTRPPSGGCASPTRSTRSRRTCSRRPRCRRCASGARAGSSTSRRSSPTRRRPGPNAVRPVRARVHLRAEQGRRSTGSPRRWRPSSAPTGIAVNAVAPEMAVATEGATAVMELPPEWLRTDRGDGRGRARARDVRSRARERPGREVALVPPRARTGRSRTLDGRELLA